MEKTLLDIIDCLDEDTFKLMTKEEKQELIVLFGRAICQKRGIPKVFIEFIDYKEGVLGFSGNLDIILNSKIDVDNYENFLLMIDTVIHESFHIFQTHLTTLSKEDVDEITWNRICTYKQEMYTFSFGNSLQQEKYRFNAMEKDAYRHTDFVLRNIYKRLKNRGAKVDKLKQHIINDRKEFYKTHRALEIKTKELRNDLSAEDYISKLLYENSLEQFICDEEKTSDKTIEEIILEFNNGDFNEQKYSNDPDFIITEQFRKLASTNFKQAVPFYFSNENINEIDRI